MAALQPFTWQHIFVPLLPEKMLSYVCAPYPFLIGVHASLLPELLAPDSEYPMSEVLVVNLDRSSVAIAGSGTKSVVAQRRASMGNGAISGGPQAFSIERQRKRSERAAKTVQSRMNELTVEEV